MSARAIQVARAGAVAGAVVLLVMIVGVATGNERPQSDNAVTDLARLGPAVDAVFTIAVTLYAALIVFTLWALWPEKERQGPMPPRARLSLPAFLFFVLVMAVIAYFGRPEPPPPLEELQELAPIGPAATVPQQQVGPSGEKPRAIEFDWTLSLAVALALCAATAFVYLRARRRAKMAALPRVGAELAAVVEETLADLRSERDARRAVIAAYAQMERVLADHGLPRRASEAPFEYLARVLQHLRVRAAAALALTELFERARFSQHDVDEEMKSEAITALDAVRADLRAAA